MPMALYDLYAVGAALVDTEIRVDDAWLREDGIAKGEMTLVDDVAWRDARERMLRRAPPAAQACGGSAANTAIAHGGLGGRAFFACAVADDEDGRFFIDELGRANVACNRELAVRSGATGRCLALVSPDAERSMLTCLGASAALSAEQLDERALAASETVYLEGYLVSSEHGLSTALKAAELASRHGVRLALSLSDPGIVRAFPDALAALASRGLDLLFCNEDEACAWSKSDELAGAAEALAELCERVVITRGADGVIASEAGHWTRVDAVAVDAVDTNGAGDMFAGAFLRALSLGRGLRWAARFAAKAAAEVVTRFGPRLPMSRYRALAAEL